MKEWQKYNCRTDMSSNPPNDVLVEVLCSDYMGECVMLAKRLDYKPGNKGFKKWRWITDNGVTLTVKETPDKWRHTE